MQAKKKTITHSKSIIQNKKECYFTGAVDGLDRHHIMNGTANRSKAEADGLWIWVRHDIHMKLHENPYAMKQLKLIGQEKWMRRKMAEGMTAEEAMYAWMLRYHRNYED